MKIAFFNIYEELNKNNFLFINNNVSIGDNLLTPMVRLKEYANSKDIEVGTTDVITIDEADAIVFIDMPKINHKTLLDAINSKKNLYLLALESPLVTPRSYDKVNHSLFKKVFTWNDELIKEDPSKYIKINYAYDIPKSINKNLTSKSKLCCIISGNKKVSYENELYSQRLEAIKWFEKYHVEDFDLYGTGWSEVVFGENKYINYILRRNRFLREFFATHRPSYKGKVERKKSTLEKYKFSICYENARDIPGYITEKIFDCFFAGCVPIYWGADNIIEHIPKECFIDKREFDTYEKLYKYMINMSDEEYMKYLDSIEIFLNSELFYPFSTDYYSKIIIQIINLNKGSL